MLFILLLSTAYSHGQNFDMASDMAIKKGNIIKNSERKQREAYMFTSAEPGDKGGVSFGDSVAVTLNGIQIYRPWDVTESAIPYPGNETIQEYLLHNLKKELGMLPDGTYQLHIDNILIDTTRTVVSYYYLGIRGEIVLLATTCNKL